jgi:hypothetical protein
MAYPDKDTAEFWDLVAQGYRQLAERPPKFMAPGSTIEGYKLKAEEAEAKAESIRNPIEFAKPTKAVEQSLQRREAEMGACGNIGPKVTVTEDLWKTVLGLG